MVVGLCTRQEQVLGFDLPPHQGISSGEIVNRGAGVIQLQDDDVGVGGAAGARHVDSRPPDQRDSLSVREGAKSKSITRTRLSTTAERARPAASSWAMLEKPATSRAFACAPFGIWVEAA